MACAQIKLYILVLTISALITIGMSADNATTPEPTTPAATTTTTEEPGFFETLFKAFGDGLSKSCKTTADEASEFAKILF